MTELTLCAQCGQSIDGKPDKDHVFGQAYGGRVTVEAHKRCNNRLGSDLEGRLTSSSGVVKLMRSIHGLAAEPVPAVSHDGRQWGIDFGCKLAGPLKPEVNVEDQGDTVRLWAIGSRGQLQGILRDWRKGFGDQVPTFTQLPPEATGQINYGPIDMKFDANTDIEAAEHFAIKVALGAGSLAFGQSFIAGPLADALRKWRDASFDNPFLDGEHHTRCHISALKAIDLQVGTACRQVAMRGGFDEEVLPPLVPAPGSRMNSATFVPLSGTTAVFVHVLSFPMPPWDLVVEAALPGGQFGRLIAPVVVQEAAQPWRVINWTEIVFQALGNAMFNPTEVDS